jgi:hypothetical protein
MGAMLPLPHMSSWYDNYALGLFASYLYLLTQGFNYITLQYANRSFSLTWLT